MNKAVIFDLDGTLLDTLPDILFCVNETLEKFGRKKIDSALLREYVGNGAREMIRLSAGVSPEEPLLGGMLDFYNRLYAERFAVDTAVFPGIKELLTALKARGYMLAVLTNKPQLPAERIIGKYFPGVFAETVGQSEKVACKPDKTETLNILSRLGVNRNHAFFVGDGDTDAMTAVNAGITGIAVLWGYRGKEELKRAGAKIFVRTPAEILDVLR